MSIKQDPVTWYGINYTGTQITQWDFQNKGKLGWTGKSSFVLEVPLRQCNLFRTMWPDPAKGQLPFKRWAHILISTNHPMERFSKNDPWVLFNKITSSSMTLSEGSRHSFRICLANERYFHIKFFSGELFCAFWSSFNTRSDLSFPKWLKMVLIKVNLYPVRWRSQNIDACRFCRRQVPWSWTLKHLSKPFIRPDWYILRKLWHTAKICLEKFTTK